MSERIHVFLGRRSGWWRWVCPTCEPANIGGFCPTWRRALTAAFNHIEDHHARPEGA